MKRLGVCMALAGLLFSPVLVQADGLSAYDDYGVCLTAKSGGKFADDPAVFDGFTVKGQAHNGHWHFDWIPTAQRPQVGQCFVGAFQRSDDHRGQHHYAFKVMVVPMGDALGFGDECEGTVPNCGYSAEPVMGPQGGDD